MTFVSQRLPRPEGNAPWLETEAHRQWLSGQALSLLDFFRPSLNAQGGFNTLDHFGRPMTNRLQELHSTTRMIHSFAIGHLAGAAECTDIIDHGMRYLWDSHRDTIHGGYVWSVDGTAARDGRKLAYGHVFVLLAGASAKQAGHPHADRLIADIAEILDHRFWEKSNARFADEFNRDWTPFSSYRGMNANMHGVEALLAAFEATEEPLFLERAGQILEFFIHQMAPSCAMRLPEHFREDWSVDPGYAENPMFRPAGTTPGHSLEMARLLLHHWDLAGRSDDRAPDMARALTYRALEDAWDPEHGGLYYTVGFDGRPLRRARYWWPVTEALGVLAALIKLEPSPEDEIWYRRLWRFADAHFIDHERGGWFPELGLDGRPDSSQFKGKPDIYHALQALAFPLAPGLSHATTGCSLG